MHVALVSTYPPTKCGIANYAKNLVGALQSEDVNVTVLAERTSEQTQNEEAIRCWHRSEDWVAQILAQLEKVRPDVVHLQHEEAILGQDRRLPKLLKGIRALGIASAVTLHSVYAGSLGVPGIRYSGRRFQRELGHHADLLIVHQIDGCQDRLIEQGIAKEKVLVIPHGTTLLTLKDKREARAELGITLDCTLLLAIGFIHKKKGLHTLVHALPAVRSQVPDIQFLIAGSFRTRPWDLLYNRSLRRAMRSGLRDGFIDLREEFHSGEAMNTMLAAADILALPYRQHYGSASGILHMALGAGAPVLCADGYKFAEAKRAWGTQYPKLFSPPEDVEAWAHAIGTVLVAPKRLAALAGESTQLGKQTSWQHVAQQHRDGFAQVLKSIR